MGMATTSQLPYQTGPDNSAAIFLGRGRLTWEAGERREDRYGYVYLLKSGDSTTSGTDLAEMIVPKAFIGTRGSLAVRVTETRQSTHIGDLFHKIYPRTPEIGMKIPLGTGRLDVRRGEDGKLCVGLLPDDGRKTWWLNPRALYDAHEQTVELMFQPTGFGSADESQLQ